MKSVHLELMDETLTVLDECRKKRQSKRNPLIEEMLWEHPEMIRAARRLKIKKLERPRVGRKPKGVSKCKRK